MDVRIVVEVDGKKVSEIIESVETLDAMALELRVEELKKRAGRAVLDSGFTQLGESLGRPHCCGRPMRNRGRRVRTVMSHSGEVTYERTRYRCRECQCWQTPADAVVCCGSHRMTRLLGRNASQLASIEPFAQLEQLMADQHGVYLGHDTLWHLAVDVGGALEKLRLAEVELRQLHPWTAENAPRPPVSPQRIYISCDGILYGTNETESNAQQPEVNQQKWRQKRPPQAVCGCARLRRAPRQRCETTRSRAAPWWHKQMTWGQEDDDLSFGMSLYALACRCGFHQAQEKIFLSDGADWCWSIQQEHFCEASGVLDWYHASQHVWECAKALFGDDSTAVQEWAQQHLSALYDAGGSGLLQLLEQCRSSPDDSLPQAAQKLSNYIRSRLAETDYPRYRSRGWTIGSGMVESSAKQLVGLRLKGPGMHWSRAGATAVTALRCAHLNGHWHQTWQNLTLTG